MSADEQYFQALAGVAVPVEPGPGSAAMGEPRRESKRKEQPWRELSVTRASEVVPARVSWLVPGMVPLGQVTLLAGRPGEGKSQWCAMLTAATTRGRLGHPAAPAVVVAVEDSLAATTVPRLMAADADLDLVRFVSAVAWDGLTEQLQLPLDVEALHREVQESGARLLTLDPISALLPPDLNSWRDSSVRSALAPLHRLAEEQECAVVVVAHLNKSASDDPLNRISGSVGFGGLARSVLLLAKDPDDAAGEAGSRRVLAHVKSNCGPLMPSQSIEIEQVLIPAGDGWPELETSRVRVIGEHTLSGRELLARHGERVEEQTALAEARELLTDLLQNGPVPAENVRLRASELGLSKRTLDRAKAALRVESVKDGFRGGWVWQLPSTEGCQPSGQPSQTSDGGNLRRYRIDAGIEGGSEGLGPTKRADLRLLAPFDGEATERSDAAASAPGEVGFIAHLRRQVAQGAITRDEQLKQMREHGIALGVRT